MTVRMEAVAEPVVEAARDETKDWLRIDGAADDAAIAAACRAAIGMAEGFCGQMLFARAGEEEVSATDGWQRLTACPVRSIGAVRALAADGEESAVPEEAVAKAIDADGDGWLRVARGAAPGRVAVALTAGMAEGWDDAPEPLRQGAVRLAAHLFSGGEGAAPPAVVTALWRPWRRLRLA